MGSEETMKKNQFQETRQQRSKRVDFKEEILKGGKNNMGFFKNQRLVSRVVEWKRKREIT